MIKLMNYCNLLTILQQLSSLRSGHRRITGSPTNDDQNTGSQSSVRASAVDNKNDSTKKTNKVNSTYKLSQYKLYLA